MAPRPTGPSPRPSARSRRPHHFLPAQNPTRRSAGTEREMTMSWHSWLVVLALGQAGPAELTPKQQSELGTVMTEFRQGGHLVVVQKLAPLIVHEATFSAVDAELRRR